MGDELPIIVFSHLRWEFVYQRPQHLLSRLSARRRVFFVEEPLQASGAQPFWVRTAHGNVTVCRPHTAIREHGFSDRQIAALRPLVRELVASEELGECLAWLYTPLALPLAEELAPKLVIYDIMDELSAFAFAPPRLLEREAALLKAAGVAFTGGPSLHRAKLGRHPNLHCFPSSVDAGHFRQARAGAQAPPAEPAEQAALPHPRLGFFGVIDERLDLGLLAALADAHPEWSIALVGPVVKIDPAQLPQRPNLHYFGQRAYADLPAFLAGWDACLLPFALNEATRFISPTKTLEYMAAERPIVSTPIADVAEPYGHIAYLGATAAEFIAACEQALAAGPAERERRAGLMRDVLAQTSWDRTARAMERLIDEALAPPARSLARGARPASATHAGGQLAAAHALDS